MTGHTENVQVEMAKVLYNMGALKFGVFKLASGKVSPYYVDLRIAPSFPDAFRQICDFYVQGIINRVGVERFDRIAGIPLSGLPFASQVAYSLKKPFLYVRKGVKLHGRQRRVAGILISGDRVLLIDDLVTTGLTLRKAAEAVRAEGGVVNEAVALIDREEGGEEKLRRAGIQLKALLRISELAKILNEMDALDDEGLETILKQVKKKKAA